MLICPRSQGALLLVALIVAFILPAAATSPTAPSTPPIVDDHGSIVRTSIASLEPVTVNGAEEWLLLRGHDIWSPVVLCLDSLPGISDLPLHRRYASELEKHFIVVGWDPRGTGKSPRAKAPAQPFLDQYVADAIEVARKLKERFRQDRIYLVGQGFGAVVGALAAREAPELFHAFVAVDPIVNAGESEQAAYEFALDDRRRARRRGPPGAAHRARSSAVRRPRHGREVRDAP